MTIWNLLKIYEYSKTITFTARDFRNQNGMDRYS